MTTHPGASGDVLCDRRVPSRYTVRPSRRVEEVRSGVQGSVPFGVGEVKVGTDPVPDPPIPTKVNPVTDVLGVSLGPSPNRRGTDGDS